MRARGAGTGGTGNSAFLPGRSEVDVRKCVRTGMQRVPVKGRRPGPLAPDARPPGELSFSGGRPPLLARLRCKPVRTHEQRKRAARFTRQPQGRNAPAGAPGRGPRPGCVPGPRSGAGQSTAGPGSLFAIPQPDREPLGVGVLWGLFEPSVSAGGGSMVGMWQARRTCLLGGRPLSVSWFVDSFRNCIESQALECKMGSFAELALCPPEASSAGRWGAQPANSTVRTSARLRCRLIGWKRGCGSCGCARVRRALEVSWGSQL